MLGGIDLDDIDAVDAEEPGAPQKMSLEEALRIAAAAGTLRMDIHVPWIDEPWQRAGRIFEGIWGWLSSLDAASWDVADSLARHFHPDYRMDQKTRRLDPNLAPGAMVFQQMERGEYSELWVKAAAPTLYEFLPKSKRGKGAPTEYLIATLFVAAQLAVHEFANLDDEMRKDSPDWAVVSTHLYYFERFASMWRRVAENKPASLNLNRAKRNAAQSWRSDLVKFHRERVAARPTRRVSARESAAQWCTGRDSPTFEVAYKALQKALREKE
jgi:hypothetical protein